MTASNNLVQYSCKLKTRMVDLVTSKILWNSILSTEVTKYTCIDIKNFYLGTPLNRYEYMHIPLDLFSEYTIQQYNLQNK